MLPPNMVAVYPSNEGLSKEKIGLCLPYTWKSDTIEIEVYILLGFCGVFFWMLLQSLTLSLPELNLESVNVVLTFESANETLVCDHSIESYREVLSSGVVCFGQLCKMKFKIFPSELNLALLGVNRKSRGLSNGGLTE